MFTNYQMGGLDLYAPRGSQAAKKKIMGQKGNNKMSGLRRLMDNSWPAYDFTLRWLSAIYSEMSQH